VVVAVIGAVVIVCVLPPPGFHKYELAIGAAKFDVALKLTLGGVAVTADKSLGKSTVRV